MVDERNKYPNRKGTTKRTIHSKYRLIMSLLMTWKILTAQIKNALYVIDYSLETRKDVTGKQDEQMTYPKNPPPKRGRKIYPYH